MGMKTKEGRALCKSCTAPMRFVGTVAGATIPLDEEPVTGGPAAAQGMPGRVVLSHVEPDLFSQGPPANVYRVASPVEEFDSGVEVFVSHFATCPNADEHRSDAK